MKLADKNPDVDSKYEMKWSLASEWITRCKRAHLLCQQLIPKKSQGVRSVSTVIAIGSEVWLMQMESKVKGQPG